MPVMESPDDTSAFNQVLTIEQLFYIISPAPVKGGGKVPRVVDEPISVYINKKSVLSAFIWRKRFYRVSGVLCWWREPSAWWNQEPVRLLIRITARRSVTGIYELCRKGADWFMHRVID